MIGILRSSVKCMIRPGDLFLVEGDPDAPADVGLEDLRNGDGFEPLPFGSDLLGHHADQIDVRRDSESQKVPWTGTAGRRKLDSVLVGGERGLPDEESESVLEQRHPREMQRFRQGRGLGVF